MAHSQNAVSVITYINKNQDKNLRKLIYNHKVLLKNYFSFFKLRQNI